MSNRLARANWALAIALTLAAPSWADDDPTVITENVATGLEVPWGLAFAPDGRLFLNERPGRVRVITGGVLAPTPVIDLTAEVVATGESGLCGIAVDPDFATNHYLFVYHTYRAVSGLLTNRIVRLIEAGDRATVDRVIVDNIPGEVVHDGGRIKFGPDGFLYVGTGDAGVCTRAQDLQSLGGKILRVTRDGTPAPGNPFPSAPLVYSYGHRNVQGLAWDATGQLYNTEHGPTGDCGYGGSNDEVNIIFAGANYGWPICVGICADPRFVDPVKLFFPDTAAPSGATFLRSNLVPQWTGSLFFGTMGFPGNDFARHLHRIVFDVDGRTVLFEEPLFSSLFGRIRDAVEGPDGFIYFSNSNRDGRGGDVLGPDDDRVVRIRPAPPP